jgi:hypothetical protein
VNVTDPNRLLSYAREEIEAAFSPVRNRNAPVNRGSVTSAKEHVGNAIAALTEVSTLLDETAVRS